jgi:Multiubiquitin
MVSRIGVSCKCSSRRLQHIPIAEEKIKMSNEQEQKGEKEFKIFVNTREKEVKTDTLSFDDVVKLAFGSIPTGDGAMATVIFHDADQKPADGSLVQGQSVKIKNGTSFDVTPTNRS